MALLGLFHLGPLSCHALEDTDNVIAQISRSLRFRFLCHSSSCATSLVVMIALLLRSAYCTYADARCSTQMTGCCVFALTLCSVLSSPSPVRPNDRNGL